MLREHRRSNEQTCTSLGILIDTEVDKVLLPTTEQPQVLSKGERIQIDSAGRTAWMAKASVVAVEPQCPSVPPDPELHATQLRQPPAHQIALGDQDSASSRTSHQGSVVVHAEEKLVGQSRILRNSR